MVARQDEVQLKRSEERYGTAEPGAAPPRPDTPVTQSRRLTYLLALNALMILALVIVGFAARSLGVLAAGGDSVADSLAIALGLIAIRLRDRHGKAQAPTYVALVNGSLLLIVTLFVIIGAVRRLLTASPDVHGLPVLIVSSISMVAMFAGAFILGQGAGNEDLHMRSVLLDTLSDALSAAAVAVVGAIIYFTHGLYWLDAAAAIAIGLLIGYGAVTLLVAVARALRHGQPLRVPDDD